MSAVGLYVHVPFCKTRCVYCDFDSSALADRAEVARYVGAVAAEARAAAAYLGEISLRTVYLGGGTPTAVGPSALTALISSVRTSFDLSDAAEFTCEANPESATSETLEALLRAGVNRLSLGIESFDDARLRWMGRGHTAAAGERAFNAARLTGFKDVSLDLIYGLPDQTPGGWLSDISKAVEMRPEHVSIYCLQLGPDAPIMKKGGGVSLPDDEAVAEMYYAAKDALAAAGYRHYEISNFARPGYECRHNVNYWRDGEYVGLGPSAASHLGGARYTNPRGLDAYVKALAAGRWPLAPPEPSDPAREARTAFVLGLRLLNGVGIAVFESGYGPRVLKTFDDDISRLTDAGLLESRDGTVRLTRRGLFLSDEVFSRLI